jgi:hypothetical protein
MRTMKLPVERMRRIRRLLELAVDLHRSPAEVGQARRLLRAADDATFASAVQVHVTVLGAAPAAAEVCQSVLSAEPQVRAPLPVTGGDLRDLGLAGPIVGATLRKLEATFCQTGQLDRGDALEAARAAAA